MVKQALWVMMASLALTLRQSESATFKNDQNPQFFLRNSLIGKSKEQETEQDLPGFMKNDEKFEEENGFSWKSCGQSGDTGHVNSLSVGPDPIKLPGNVTVSFSGGLSTLLSAPVTVELKLEKKELFWITVPCINNVGSCTYDDICKILPSISCPPVFKKMGLPCQCPVKAGNYSIPATTVFVNPQGIPHWAESGSYRATIKVTQGTTEVICLSIQLSLN